MKTNKELQILLVEDELSHAVLIKRALESSDYAVHILSVDTIAKARLFLEQTVPDILICDFLLPDGSGEDLLPGSPEAAEYPAILMTSHGDEEVAVSAIKSGAADYVVKSDRTIAEIPSLIERVLRDWDLKMQARAANEALQENERFLSSIFDAIRDGMCVLDTDLTIIKVNSWLEKLVPESAPILGKKCSAMFCRGRYCETCPATRLTKTGQSNSADIHFFPGEDREIWFDVSAFPLLDRAGKIVGSILHYKDITDNKRNEERNQILEAQLIQAQKLESIGQLAGGIAHDFNNLLTTIIGNSELALLELEPGSEAHEEIQEINKTAGRAAVLTKQLLAFSRRQAAEPREVDLHEAFANTGSFLRRLIGETISLEMDLGEPLWSLLIDPGQLDQILTNLLVNARDAMPEGGTVSLSASNIKIEEDSGKALSGIAPGEYVRIEVADTGTGMTDEVKQQIFEPFFTTKERGKGTGLGLATCYGIIRQNKGAIEVESVIGVGTSFAVFLPRYVGTGTEAKEETKKAVPLNGSETVLVVEDESAIRGMIARMLENSGYHVLTAESGEVALQLLSSEAGAPVTLIISDIIMPGIDGNEMARRAREIIEEVSVLFISGYSQDILGNRGIIDTEINYIQKPFTRDQLLGAVFEIFRTGAMS